MEFAQTMSERKLVSWVARRFSLNQPGAPLDGDGNYTMRTRPLCTMHIHTQAKLGATRDTSLGKWCQRVTLETQGSQVSFILY